MTPMEGNMPNVNVQPVVFDLINKVVHQVGIDRDADRRYAEIVAAQQHAVTAAGAPKREH